MEAIKNVKAGQVFNIALIIIILFGLWKVLRMFGIFKSASEQREEKQSEQLGTIPAIDQKYFTSNTIVNKLKKKYPNLTGAQITAIQIPNLKLMPTFANQIWDAKGIFKDEEDAVFGVFRKLKSKMEVSFFADYFYSQKKRDLYGFLTTFLNAKELATLYRIIDQKPEII